MEEIKPAVQIEARGVVRALPRVAAGSAVVHLLNYAYDVERDDVSPLVDVQVHVDLHALGVSQAVNCEFHSPDAKPRSLPINDGTIVLPRLNLWGMLVFRK